MKTRTALLLAATICLPLGAFAALTPAEYVPMKVIQTDPAIYPSGARIIGLKEGMAHVTIAIDDHGKLTDYLLTAYSYPAFGDAAVAAIKRWEYEPAYVHGQARPALVDLDFEFESEGIVVVSLDVNTYVQQLNYRMHPGSYGYHAATLRELDRIPTPTKVVHPAYALESSKTLPDVVTITVKFFIDEKGHVRMPAVSRETASSGNEILAAAAVAAVSQWEFEPPMSRGQPVLVSVRQDFNFRPKS